jgi:integrase
MSVEASGRREEILSLKFSDIIEYKDGTKNIRTEDFKVNRIQNRNESGKKKFNFIPVTASLLVLLNELDYERNKDTDNFILAPEITKNRTRIMADILTKGFSHYYDQLNTGEHLTFKSLRKTYVTNLEIFMGNAKAITGHSSDEVLRGHYLDQESISRAARNYSVFPATDNRKESLEQIRNSGTIDEKGKGMEK